MTDRELLELAAKAAGFGLPDKGDHDEIGRQYDYHLGLWTMWDYGQWSWFRPHLDDGQALRLAVKLQIHMAKYDNYVSACQLGPAWEGEVVVWDHEEPDPYAATRRAITRAAAEIGRAK